MSYVPASTCSTMKIAALSFCLSVFLFLLLIISIAYSNDAHVVAISAGVADHDGIKHVTKRNVPSRSKRSYKIDLTKNSLTTAEKISLVIKHNSVRSQVQPSASDMLYMV